MYFKIGSYTTENNASWATWTYAAKVSPRGRKISEVHRVTLHTILTETTQAALTTSIAAHEAGVRQQNVDLIFYEDDGTETAHKIVNAQTRDGLTFKGISYPGYFPNFWGSGSEYAEGSALRYVVSQHEAEVLDVEDNILAYWQGYKFNTGGYDYAVVEALNGLPQIQITKQQAKAWLIQRGYAIGAFSNPSPASPLATINPMPHRSWIDYESPMQQGRVDNIGFRTSWSFYYEANGSLAAIPPENP